MLGGDRHCSVGGQGRRLGSLPGLGSRLCAAIRQGRRLGSKAAESYNSDSDYLRREAVLNSWAVLLAWLLNWGGCMMSSITILVFWLGFLVWRNLRLYSQLDKAVNFLSWLGRALEWAPGVVYTADWDKSWRTTNWASCPGGDTCSALWMCRAMAWDLCSGAPVNRNAVDQVLSAGLPSFSVSIWSPVVEPCRFPQWPQWGQTWVGLQASFPQHQGSWMSSLGSLSMGEECGAVLTWEGGEVVKLKMFCFPFWCHPSQSREGA